MPAIPGATSEDEFCRAPGGQRGRVGCSFGRGGALKLQIYRAQSEGWAFTRNLVFLVLAKRQNLRTQSARRRRSLFLFGFTSFEPFPHPLVRELEDLHVRWYGEYCKSRRGQW